MTRVESLELRNKVPSTYYDSPWLPTAGERDEWTSLFLSPCEAHYIKINYIADGLSISSLDRRTLNTIINGEEPKDFLALRRELEAER